MTWTAPATGGLDITGYEIRVWDGSQWVNEAYPAATDTTYKDAGLTPATPYHYVIRASNSQGAGPWSMALSATVANAAPGVPVLTATATGKTTIVLEWTAPNNNGAAITDYDLQRWTPAASGPGGDWAMGGDDDLLNSTTAAQTLPH